MEENFMNSVFVVEKDPYIRNLYKGFLTSLGFEVLAVAKNGEEAVDRFKHSINKPDIIFMDYQIPIKNGISAANEILELDEKVKIFLVSAEKSVKAKALSMGVFDSNEKNAPFYRLVRNISNFLESNNNLPANAITN
jgi:two-component system chemotaxis response regulator CheY